MMFVSSCDGARLARRLGLIRTERPMLSVDPFMRAENIKRFRTLLAGEPDSEQRKRLQTLLQREEAALRMQDQDGETKGSKPPP